MHVILGVYSIVLAEPLTMLKHLDFVEADLDTIAVPYTTFMAAMEGLIAERCRVETQKPVWIDTFFSCTN